MADIFSGSTENKVQIPKFLEEGFKYGLQRGKNTAELGYMPYMGPEVAAFTPAQTSAMQNTFDASRAFGMSAPDDAMAGMPQAQTFAGGIQGYSSYPTFQESLDKLRQSRSGQMAAYDAMFIDPVTGVKPQGFATQSPIGGTTAPMSDTMMGNPMMNPTSTIGSGTQISPTVTISGPAQAVTPQSPFTAQDIMPTAEPYTVDTSFPGQMDMPQQPTFDTPQPVTVNDIASIGSYENPSYTTETTTPTLGDRVMHGLGSIGRSIVDNTSIGRGYEFFSDDSLSDTLFGEQDPLGSGATFYMPTDTGLDLTADLDMSLFDEIDNFQMDASDLLGQSDAYKEQSNIQEELDEVKEEKAKRAAATMLGMYGGVAGDTAARYSPVKSLFDAYDVKTEPGKKSGRKPTRTFRSIR